MEPPGLVIETFQARMVSALIHFRVRLDVATDHLIALQHTHTHPHFGKWAGRAAKRPRRRSYNTQIFSTTVQVQVMQPVRAVRRKFPAIASGTASSLLQTSPSQIAHPPLPIQLLVTPLRAPPSANCPCMDRDGLVRVCARRHSCSTFTNITTLFCAKPL
jgi:hypothetical protein